MAKIHLTNLYYHPIPGGRRIEGATAYEVVILINVSTSYIVETKTQVS